MAVPGGSAGCLALGPLLQNSPEWLHSLSGCLLTACFVPGCHAHYSDPSLLGARMPVVCEDAAICESYGGSVDRRGYRGAVRL